MQKNIGNDFSDFSDQQKIASSGEKIFDKAEKSSNMLKKSSKTLGITRAREYFCNRIQVRWMVCAWGLLLLALEASGEQKMRVAEQKWV